MSPNIIQLASRIRQLATPNLFKESERLKTFLGWPCTFLSPNSLAKAGFYYLKKGDDSVKCPFCGIEVFCWEQGDDPLEDHKKWSPQCRFVLGTPGSGNISIQEETTVSHGGVDTCAPYDIPGVDVVNRIDDLGIPKNNKKPAFPEFGTPESRLKSFEHWPLSLKVRPKELCDAGFFYSGTGDQTICFYCGGGLRDWEDGDDPWVEHAEWFRKCAYVLLSKGEDFVNSVTINAQSVSSATEPAIGTDGLESTRSTVTPRQAKTSSSSVKASPSTSKEALAVEDEKSGTSDKVLCKICYAKEMGVVFLPCGHLVACVDCALNITSCAVCRKPIDRTLRTFLS